MPVYRLLGGCRAGQVCQQRLLSGGKGVEGIADEAEVTVPRLQGHEDEDRAQSVHRDPSAPTSRTERILRGRSSEDWRGCGGAQSAGAEGQADGRCQLRVEPVFRDRDGPRDGEVQSLLDRGAGRELRHRGQRARRGRAAHADRRLRDRTRPVRLSRADPARRGRYRAGRYRLVRGSRKESASPPMPRRITGWSRRTPLWRGAAAVVAAYAARSRTL